MPVQKRILALNDISCFGKCSLTVALPIISSTGLECTILPNCVLSTHTAIEGFTLRDLTGEMVPIIEHWKKLGLRFDGIYTGFMCTKEQIDIARTAIEGLRGEGTFVVVDPAMADNGKLYPIFDSKFPPYMRELCSVADIIKPNITEACMMLGREYKPGPYTKEWIEDLLKELSQIGARNIILTGVSFDESKIGAASYDCSTGKVEYHLRDTVPGYYHGTGDVFCSAVVAAVGSGHSLGKATEMAVDLTTDSIRRTYEAGTDVRFGVNFEDGLAEFAAKVRSRRITRS